MKSRVTALRFAASIMLCSPLMFFGAASTAAEAYPTKPVKIIVTYPPGGSTDTITRLIGHALSEKWNQPVIVENRGGSLGHDRHHGRRKKCC